MKRQSKESGSKLLEAIKEVKEDFKKNGWHTLSYSAESTRGIRLDYSQKGYTYRVDGDFGTMNGEGSISLPMLRAIKGKGETKHRNYILTINVSGKMFGQIKKIEGSKIEVPDIRNVSDLSQYHKDVSVGLGIIRSAVEKGDENFSHNKPFTIQEKIGILTSVARAGSVLEVLSELIRRANAKKSDKINPREAPELLKLHRLV